VEATAEAIEVLNPETGSQVELKAARTEQEIKKAVMFVREVWTHLALQLYLFHEGKMWETLGYESFEEWCDSPELDFEPRYAYQLIDNYKTVVIDHGVPEEHLALVGPSKVKTVLVAVRRGIVPVEDALADCESLRKRDLETKYKRLLARGDDANPPLDASAEPVYDQCPTCGKRYRVKAGTDA